MKRKRAWLYCRVAHGGPVSAEVLVAQRHRLEAYANEHNFEIIGTSGDIGSGLRFAHRPGLLGFHTAAMEGKVDILLVCNLARLARDLDKSLQYWDFLRHCNVSIHTADSGEVDLSIAAMLHRSMKQ